MGPRRRYRKKADQYIVAVQLALDTEGFTYRKWGALQRCRRGDWLVDINGDIHSVDREVFAATYRQVRPGHFIKTTPIWAEVAAVPGFISTKEGASHYDAGDYLVANNENGTDAYCISAAKFESMYELDE
ncbi:MAG: hypothetical protein PVG19_12445 [Desulfobacterales bacterium]|jgi:hypothetical protein